MATTEQNALIRAKDVEGNSSIIYPITKAENVDGLEESLAGKSDTSHTHNDTYYTEMEIDSKIAELNTSISGKANTSHTHSIVDIEEVESSTTETLLGEGTITNSLIPSTISKVELAEGQVVRATIDGIDYTGTCSFSPTPSYHFYAGDYKIYYAILDGRTRIDPVPPDGTTITLTSIELTTKIPEEYIPDTIARKQDVDKSFEDVDKSFEDVDTALADMRTTIQETVDNAIANSTSINIITWEEGD